MASGPHLTGERLTRFRPLGATGEPVHRSATQLRAAISGRLGARFADLFAVPQIDAQGERIDWYAPFEGEVVPWSALPADRRAALLARVAELRPRLEELAAQMDANPGGDQRAFGRLLRLALSVPSEDMLFSVAGRPVYAFWGFGGEAQLPGAFIGGAPLAAPRPPIADPPPTAAAAAPGALAAGGAGVVEAQAGPLSWLKWLLLALFLLLLLALLAWWLRPYLPNPLGLAEHGRARVEAGVPAPANPDAALAEERARAERLRSELATLREELAKKQTGCAPGRTGGLPDGPRTAEAVPGAVVVGPDGAPVGRVERGPDGKDVVVGPDGRTVTGPDGKPVDPKEFADRAKRGEIPPPPRPDMPKGDQAKAEQPKSEPPRADAPKAPPKADPAKDQAKAPPAPPAPPAPKMEKPLVVPPDARAKGDVGFLKGDWRSQSGLTTQSGEEEIKVDYQFDDTGQGKVTIRQKDGVVCEGPAKARFDGSGKLLIEELANPKCSDGTTFAKSTVTCDVDPKGGADCKGRNDGGKSYSVQIGK